MVRWARRWLLPATDGSAPTSWAPCAPSRTIRYSRKEERHSRWRQCLIITTLLHPTSSHELYLERRTVAVTFAAEWWGGGHGIHPHYLWQSRHLMEMSASRTTRGETNERMMCRDNSGESLRHQSSVNERKVGRQGSWLGLHVVASLDRPW